MTPARTSPAPRDGGAAQPRASGEVRLSAALRGGAHRLDGLRQAGSLRCLLPRPSGPFLDAVLLNAGGGLTGGDRMAVEARAGAGAALRLSTQGCERAYRSGGGEALVTTRLRAEEGARLLWLPQETILFDGSRLRRSLRVDLAPTARALLLEPLVVGRAARGEGGRDLGLRDAWELRVGGRLLLADALRLEGDAAEALDGPSGGGARALATLLLASPEAEARLPALRALLPARGEARGGAGMLAEGALIVRLLAADGFALRSALIPLITSLAPLPKVWRL